MERRYEGKGGASETRKNRAERRKGEGYRDEERLVGEERLRVGARELEDWREDGG